MSRLARWRLRARQTRAWWARTWWFQFAHSALCRRFEGDVLRIGRLHLCRSCTLLYGAMVATIGVFLWPGVSDAVAAGLCYGTLLPVVVLSYPPLYGRVPRLAKDVLRSAIGVALGFLFCLLTTPFWWPAALTWVLLYPLFLAFKRKRRAVKATECEGCPELETPGVCSGFARQADSIRAFRDRMDDELNRPGVAELIVLSRRT